MSIAERLYTQGYISYPRTETSKYPDNFDLDSVLKEQSRQSNWYNKSECMWDYLIDPLFLSRGQYCEDLLKNGYTRPTSGTDVGDHPPM